jgi:CRISPR-associated protein Csd1
LRSILTGTPYPDGLYAAVVRRIRADGHVDRARAAILKAYLVRRARHAHVSLEVPVSLDPNHPDPAYQLGRLFAVLEKLQKDALGDKLNATIKDRFFGAASATPASVFPRLVRLSQHHLSALETIAYRSAHEKRIGEICDRLPASGFPPHLNLSEQGLFAVAYYQQNRALYKRREHIESAEE